MVIFGCFECPINCDPGFVGHSLIFGQSTLLLQYYAIWSIQFLLLYRHPLDGKGKFSSLGSRSLE